MSKSNELPILTKASLIGEQGMDMVKLLAPELGFYFRDVTKGDYGIDAHLELFENTPDLSKHYMTGRIIAAQIKCGETIARSRNNEWLIYCSNSNINYWINHSLPVILIYCDARTNACYWTQIDGSSIERKEYGWVVTISKNNKLEGAKEKLAAIALGKSISSLCAFPRMFTLPFDEQSGLQIMDDDELGVLCSEISAAASSGLKPDIMVDITTELIVASKLDELNSKAKLSVDERKERVHFHDIDSRYKSKKKNIAAAVLLMITHPSIGAAYFIGRDYALQGQALRHLVDSFKITYSIGTSPAALMIDAFPSMKKTEPLVRLYLNELEKKELTEKACITDIDVQLVAYWGFRTFDLPNEVFLAKFIPSLTRALLTLSQRKKLSVDELIKEIGIPIEAWVIGIS